MQQGGSYTIEKDGDEPKLVDRTESPADGVTHVLPPEVGGPAPAEEAPAPSARRARAARTETTPAAAAEPQE